MKLLRYLLLASRKTFLAAVISSLLGGLGSALLVAQINQALQASGSEGWRILLFAGLVLLVPFLRWFSQSRFVQLQQFALARLRVLLSRHIAHAPFVEIERETTRFTAVLIEDVSTVSEFFVALPRFVMQGAIVLGSFCYLAWLSWQALMFALSMVALGSLIHFWAVRRASAHLERARLEEDTLYEQFRTLVSAGKELRLSRARRDHFWHCGLEPSVERVREHNTRGFLAYVGAGSFGAFMFFAVIGGVIFGLGSLLHFDRTVRSGYALVFLYTMFPLEDLLEAVPDLLRVRIALARIREVCGRDVMLGPPEAAVVSSAPLASVALAEVRHRYQRDAEDGVFELGPLTLRVSAGEIVFLIGGNGGGKTTLAKLFVGLYAPESGDCLLNGQVVTQQEREAYRQHFSAIFSDFYLFDSTLGLSALRVNAESRALLQFLGLESKVEVRDGAFSTTALSSGQRKRLALFVACLEDRPVCVFDEWAADQDPAYKEVFYTVILPGLKAQGKAVLVITHDDRYFHVADRCLKLESGRLSAASLVDSTCCDPTQKFAPEETLHA